MKMKYLSQSGHFASGNPRLYIRLGKARAAMPDSPRDSAEFVAAYKAAMQCLTPTERCSWRPIDPDFRERINEALRRAKERARAKALPYDLSLRDVEMIFVRQRGRCALTGLRFSNARDGCSYRRPFVPSLDRIRPSDGYVEANVRLVCAAANLARGDFSDATLLAVARGIARNFVSVDVSNPFLSNSDHGE